MAKKSLGQHFLRSERALNKIIEAGDIHPDDLVVEIGPGEGVLTERILDLAGKVVAIEKDHDLVDSLGEKFADDIKSSKLQLLDQDALKWDPEILRSVKKPYKLIANIPYYITGAIIEKYLSAHYQPSLAVLLMQKEVAERIVAKDRKESILSIAVKVYGTPKIIDKVPPGAFAPAPTVDSAILLIDNISRDFFVDTDEGVFFEILKAVFGKKRNQIARSLGEYLGSRDQALVILNNSMIDSKTRPEDMTLQNWKTLTMEVKKIKNSVQ